MMPTIVTIVRRNQQMRYRIKCPICMQLLDKQNYLLHLKGQHIHNYRRILAKVISKFSTTEITRFYEVSDMFVINGEKKLMEKSGEYNAEIQIMHKTWEPQNYKMEATTIWSFPERGKWATHSGIYRGNWSPYVPRNLIERYSQVGDRVLDQFVGSGTTLVETKLLKRNGIGIDINPVAIELARKNTSFKKDGCPKTILRQGDARCLDFVDRESIDLICTHPPYGNIIKYSEDIVGDLSNYDIDGFLSEMKKVAAESLRVLKKGKFCAIMIGDTRRNKNIIPLGFKVMQVFIDVGFILKEIIIKEQHNCKATGFWYKRSIEYNFLLIAHEYLFVFYKPQKAY